MEKAKVSMIVTMMDRTVEKTRVDAILSCCSSVLACKGVVHLSGTTIDQHTIALYQAVLQNTRSQAGGIIVWKNILQLKNEFNDSHDVKRGSPPIHLLQKSGRTIWGK